MLTYIQTALQRDYDVKANFKKAMIEVDFVEMENSEIRLVNSINYKRY